VLKYLKHGACKPDFCSLKHFSAFLLEVHLPLWGYWKSLWLIFLS